MRTEITNTIDEALCATAASHRGTIFFDAACGICGNSALRFGGFLERRGFTLLPLQSPEATAMTGASYGRLMREAHLVTPHGRVLRGVDAIIYGASTIRWVRPLAWATRVPGVMPLLRIGYAWFADHRYGLSAFLGIRPPGAACTLAAQGGRRHTHANRRSARPRWPLYPDRVTAEAVARWYPSAIAVMTALVAGASLPPWAYMWTLALTLYAACKWITWWPSRSLGSWRRSAAYLFVYAGMNGRAFMSGARVSPQAEAARAARSTRPTLREGMLPLVNAVAGGATLLWLASSRSAPFVTAHPMLAGWIAMFALALLCHFGVLNLLALGLRRASLSAAEPLMRTPIASRSLADFWGRRWNTGYRALSHELLFEPATRRWGATTATAIAFVASGLIHDLVISVPAHAGYGLPTLYFLIQLAGLLLERTPLLRRPFARHAVLGRAYAVVFTLAPLPLLFHAAFVERCILPFLNAIGGVL